jgi:metal-sulfur cluster biosynthetic enzyme
MHREASTMTSAYLPGIAGAGDLVAELAETADRTGANAGLWPGLTVYRFTAPAGPTWEEIQSLSLCVVAQGRKSVAAAVCDALAEVIDPDLGVGVVDLGFVRAVAVDGRTAVITMTLTSAACPLTGVLEDQIRAALAPPSCVDDFRVDWQWIPAWRPADITDSGRDQLRAIGFTI